MWEEHMSKLWISLLACSALATAQASAAAPAQKGGDAKGGADHSKHEGGGKAKHQHHAKNGHAMLGAKLKQDGKHAVGKFKNRDVTAQVKGGKVVAMSAGDITPKRVRTKTKMAMGPTGLVKADWTGGSFQLAQYDSYYYGYCFDDGYDYDCYWYPAEDVDYQDYTWDDYDPYW
jgi:hypothetical protein